MNSRFSIVEEVYSLSGSTIKKKDIQICISLIVEFILKELKKDRIISIKNFGTFSTCFTKPHTARDLLSKKLLPIKSFKNIKFYPSQVLSDMLKLLNKGDNNGN